MSNFSLKHNISANADAILTKQSAVIDTTDLDVASVVYKNPIGAETEIVNYDSIVALGVVAGDIAAKNIEQDGLLTGLEANKQPNVDKDTMVTILSTTYQEVGTNELELVDYDTVAALKVVAGDVASKNIEQDGLLTGLEANKQPNVIASTDLTLASVDFNDPLSAAVHTMSYDAIETSNIAIGGAIASASANSDAIASNYKKRLMLVCGEASGIPIVSNLSPFSFGNGAKSNVRPGFGVPIPFVFDLATVSIVVDTDETNMQVGFDIVWYPQGSEVPTILASIPIDTSVQNYATWDTFSEDVIKGSLCIECTSVSAGLIDEDMQFRASMCLQCEDEFFSV
jgi:hypothetical protein